MKRRIAILGSTGSIGTQALEVIEENPELFEAYVLTANNNYELLIQQAIKHQPEIVVISNKQHYKVVKEALGQYPIKIYAGNEAVSQVVCDAGIEMVLTAMVGYAGLEPTINAIKSGKTIALANKETLVVAGEIIMALAEKHKVPIIPVDSEHSAIFQCLMGESYNPIEQIILTASGGPFRTWPTEKIQNVSVEQALNHPNWSMGAKITIDSATLMNKGFEVIEGKWLFGLNADQIEVIVHPQSIIHSLVSFEDGAIKAQLGLPSMKLPISYAFGFPKRVASGGNRFSFIEYPQFTFEKPDMQKFPCLSLAYEALKKGGNLSCIMNGANEVAVDAFLNQTIPFGAIFEVIEQTMNRCFYTNNIQLDDLVQSNTESREIAHELIRTKYTS